MYQEHTVAVVVPAYNEEESVGEVIETVPPFVDRVYVIDDGSTDDTWAVISDRADSVNAGHDGAFDEWVVPVQHAENRGVGGAIKTGYQRALADGVDVATVMAGDAQMDPAMLERYIAPIAAGEADYTKGNRFLHEDIEKMPRFRYVGNVALSYLTKIASGYWRISDSQNGYAAISREALSAIDLDGMYEYYGYCNDLLVRLNVAGMRVMDVPHSADYLYDEEWSSHIQYGEYIPRVSSMLLRDFLWRLRTKHLSGRGPDTLAALYATGMGVAVVSVVGLLAAIAGTVAGGGDADGGDRWLLGVAGGVALFLLGAVLDRETDSWLERRAGEIEDIRADSEGDGDGGRSGGPVGDESDRVGEPTARNPSR